LTEKTVKNFITLLLTQSIFLSNRVVKKFFIKKKEQFRLTISQEMTRSKKIQKFQV